MTVLTSTLLGQGDDVVAATGGAGLSMLIYLFVCFALMILMTVGMWKLFDKAGKPGWASIVPIYHFIVLLEIAGKPVWWLVLLFPFFPVIWIILLIEIAARFGKGGGFAVGLIFLPFIFFPMLGFGSATYQGAPAAAT